MYVVHPPLESLEIKTPPKGDPNFENPSALQHLNRKPIQQHDNVPATAVVSFRHRPDQRRSFKAEKMSFQTLNTKP